VVAEAGSVNEAIALARDTEFDLALLDINTKGETSVEIAGIIEQRRLPYIFVTGYGSIGLPAPFQGRRIIQKPLTIEVLQRAIALTLES